MVSPVPEAVSEIHEHVNDMNKLTLRQVHKKYSKKIPRAAYRALKGNSKAGAVIHKRRYDQNKRKMEGIEKTDPKLFLEKMREYRHNFSSIINVLRNDVIFSANKTRDCSINECKY